ncbi:hypothetical protein FXW78_29425 [Rhodococcus opacus]|nr:hypothetical protein [Rhodococcus opacus]
MQLRRLMGLRLELMVLAVAEVVALRCYRALVDGGRRRRVASRRLSVGFARTPAPVRAAVRRAFVADTMWLFDSATAAVFTPGAPTVAAGSRMGSIDHQVALHGPRCPKSGSPPGEQGNLPPSATRSP